VAEWVVEPGRETGWDLAEPPEEADREPPTVEELRAAYLEAAYAADSLREAIANGTSPVLVAMEGRLAELRAAAEACRPYWVAMGEVDAAYQDAAEEFAAVWSAIEEGQARLAIVW